MSLPRSANTGIKVLLVIVILVLAGVSVWSANSYKEHMRFEVTEIAEHDIPLVEKMTQITIHQLEQAIHFERALHAAGLIGQEDGAKEEFEKARQDFRGLAELADREIRDGEALLESMLRAAESASSYEAEEAKLEAGIIIEGLARIEKEHTDYESHAEQVMELVANGQMREGLALAEGVEAEEGQLDAELEAILLEIERFTEGSALDAERYQQSSENTLWIYFGISIALGVILVAMIVVDGTGKK
jgi:methyl-accepting chemotaxis protein